MSSKKQLQIKFRQKLKRRRRRLKLLEKGIDPKDYFCGRYFIKDKSKPQWEESQKL
ncbi:MAG: hypothetical protein M0R48_09060 [Candidatus Omnitrophica bacterium]|jgi:hypothetical protein|nr:hypothetical protein [Candidatus Omnitrophota bacterium]